MDITETVMSALDSTRRVKITFLPNGKPAKLLYLVRPGDFKVNLSVGDIALLINVTKSGEWPVDHDRIILVPFTYRFDALQFIEAINGQIENIEIA